MVELSEADIFALINISKGKKLAEKEKRGVNFNLLANLGYIDYPISTKTGRKLKTPQITLRGQSFLRNLFAPERQIGVSIAAQLEKMSTEFEKFSNEFYTKLQQFSNELSDLKIPVNNFVQKTGAGETVIDENTFLKATREEYSRLLRSSPIAPYVSIKILRDLVCKRLNFARSSFDTMLVSIATRDPYTIQLSTSSGEAGTGVPYGRGECHAVIVK
ncbi:MAG TPA: hypothetical protein EYP21_04030 [Syntrophaceae bacterium]|nr:hypothetical protein [Syntrophaceae bacterium]